MGEVRLVSSGGQGVARRGAPEYGAIVREANISRWTRSSLGALEPPELTTILQNAQRGDLERFADLVSYMLRTDAHVRSTWLTRTTAVAGADFVVEPGRAGLAKAQLARDAAEFCQEQLQETNNITDRLADLLHGVGVGVGVLEHRWRPSGRVVTTEPAFVHPRNLRYVGPWRLQVRTYPQDAAPRWVNLDEHPNKFIVHEPHNIAEAATLTGELMAVTWPWLFKRWIEKYGISAFERMANGIMVGITPTNSTDEVRKKLREGIENLAADGAVIAEELVGGGDPIRILEPSRDPGETMITLLRHYANEISKGLLGSGLNVEVQETGGNRSLGESQFDTTILPRLMSDATRLARTIERQWLRPLLQFNAHLFGGVTPPTPRLRFELVADEVVETAIDAITINARAVTVDEVRERSGLRPWGAERGGDRVVEPLQQGPAFNERQDITPPGGADAAAPFSTSRRRRAKRKPRQAKQLSIMFSPTAERCALTPLGLALSARSADPAR